MELLNKAWEASAGARLWRSKTKVGCAILTTSGRYLFGWNIDGLWATSIHAEVNAISRLGVDEKISEIAIVAKTSFFTPCGACMDWIFQFSTPDTIIYVQNKDMVVTSFKYCDLMPHYPIR